MSLTIDFDANPINYDALQIDNEPLRIGSDLSPVYFEAKTTGDITWKVFSTVPKIGGVPPMTLAGAPLIFAAATLLDVAFDNTSIFI